MKNEEINKYIAVEIMRLCPHAKRQTYIDPGPVFTERCQDCHRLATFPDYCSDASPRSLLNEVVAKVWNPNKTEVFFLAASSGLNQTNHGVKQALALADAERIARACVEAHKTTTVDKDA